MNSPKKKLIVGSIGICYYLAVAIVLLVFFIDHLDNYDIPAYFLITVMLLSAIPDVVMYTVMKGYKNPKKIGHIIWAGLTITTCIVLYSINEIDISIICIAWGIIDILRGLDELYTVFFDGKFEKREIPDLIIACVDIVLGVILIIKLDDGLNVHLLAATATLFVFAIRLIIELIFDLKELKNAKDSE